MQQGSKKLSHSFIERIAYLLCTCALLTSCGGEEMPDAVQSTSSAGAAIALPLEESQVDNMICVRYTTMAGGEAAIWVKDDVTVNELYANIEVAKGLNSIKLVYKTDVLDKNDDRKFRDVVPGAEHDALTLVINNNLASIKELITYYIGPEEWRDLNPPDIQALDNGTLPPVSDEMLKAAKRLNQKNQTSLLVLDYGKSMAYVQSLCEARGVAFLSNNSHMSTKERNIYEAEGMLQWLLLHLSDHGELKGSRNMIYTDQSPHMRNIYPKYQNARESITVTILMHLVHEGVLFSSDPRT